MPDLTEFKLAETVAVLARTPVALDALLRELPSVWIHGTEGDGTWSVFDIVGHLVCGERSDWMPRVRILLEHGETRSFPPFDRTAQFQENQVKTLQQLLTDFAGLRKESLEALQALKLQPEDMERKGTHPAFGVVTLSELLATWAIHDLNHLHQLSRVMANQYRDLVGPWSAYLGVLQCTGHGAA